MSYSGLSLTKTIIIIKPLKNSSHMGLYYPAKVSAGTRWTVVRGWKGGDNSVIPRVAHSNNSHRGPGYPRYGPGHTCSQCYTPAGLYSNAIPKRPACCHPPQTASTLQAQRAFNHILTLPSKLLPRDCNR